MHSWHGRTTGSHEKHLSTDSAYNESERAASATDKQHASAFIPNNSPVIQKRSVSMTMCTKCKGTRVQRHKHSKAVMSSSTVSSAQKLIDAASRRCVHRNEARGTLTRSTSSPLRVNTIHNVKTRSKTHSLWCLQRRPVWRVVTYSTSNLRVK